ncbi:hypothetical protein Glove_114g62 [Diversispora epigaea]|uniref:Uncharacterized protein n=1 Tax=Diversispora epigaea TaxID=1348612 RepID=A0A397J5R6_9GLOM|nr:hypothetical protein Glove_114g62 [Diversispora epigaea]
MHQDQLDVAWRKTSVFKKDGNLIKLYQNTMRTLNVLLKIVPKECIHLYLIQSFIFKGHNVFNNWADRTDVLSTARAINKATTNVIENNNIYLTSVDDTPQKKKSNKNQPLPKFPSPNSLPPSFSSSGRDLIHHLDSSVHKKIDLNDLDNTLFKSKN